MNLMMKHYLFAWEMAPHHHLYNIYVCVYRYSLFSVRPTPLYELAADDPDSGFMDSSVLVPAGAAAAVDDETAGAAV